MGVVIDLATGEQRSVRPRDESLARLKRKRVAFFRTAAALHGNGPTILTPDEDVYEIYSKVFRAFSEACRTHRVRMPNRWKMSFIVLKFLEVNEIVGTEIIEPLLACEVRYYVERGLRVMYDQELKP
jgi:hypothetical protein